VFVVVDCPAHYPGLARGSGESSGFRPPDEAAWMLAEGKIEVGCEAEVGALEAFEVMVFPGALLGVRDGGGATEAELAAEMRGVFGLLPAGGVRLGR
jgi:hypothetical protein